MELTVKQKQALKKIGDSYQLRFIILHGSYAKGIPRQGSDLDIALLGKNPIAFEVILRMFGEFEEIFGNSRERELDIKSLHGVDPLFRHQVVRKCLLLYGDARKFNEFKLYAERAYDESRDLRELEMVLLKKSIAHIATRL